MDRRLNSEQLLTKWELRREVENLMVKFFSQDYILRREKDMYKNYWSVAEDVCLTVNDGAYKGAAAVEGYYKAIEERTKLESKLIQKKYPTRLGEKSDEEIYGAGVMDMKAIVAPVIEVAGDNKTAKGLWTVNGMNTKLTPGGQVSDWERGYVGADFIRENDEWKVWHLIYVQDLDHASGYSWEEPEPVFEDDPIYAEVRNFSFPEPNVKKVVYEKYYANRPLYAPPAYPEAYDTFAETFSYGM